MLKLPAYLLFELSCFPLNKSSGFEAAIHKNPAASKPLYIEPTLPSGVATAILSYMREHVCSYNFSDAFCDVCARSAVFRVALGLVARLRLLLPSTVARWQHQHTGPSTVPLVTSARWETRKSMAGRLQRMMPGQHSTSTCAAPPTGLRMRRLRS